MADVTTIHGGHIPGQPDPDVVKVAEDLLERAKAGTLIGLAYATVGDQGEQATGWVGAAGTRHQVGTGIDILQQRYVWAQWHPDEGGRR